MIIRLIFVLAFALVWTDIAWAQRPPDPGRYDMKWSQFDTGQRVDLTFGTREVEVAPVSPGECPPTSTIVLRDITGPWCFLPNGSIDGSSGATGEGDVFLPNGQGGFDGFFMRGERASATSPEFTFVGSRQTPTPPPSPVKVFITQPKAGATISGTVWVVVWAEGTTASSNVFTLSVDGKVIQSVTSSSRGPITMPWYTIANPNAQNGAHTLGASVRDATGKTGSTSITVIVNN
jgi:hypothetical protein